MLSIFIIKIIFPSIRCDLSLTISHPSENLLILHALGAENLKIRFSKFILLYNPSSRAEVTKHCYMNHFEFIQMFQAKATANSAVQ